MPTKTKSIRAYGIAAIIQGATGLSPETIEDEPIAVSNGRVKPAFIPTVRKYPPITPSYQEPIPEKKEPTLKERAQDILETEVMRGGGYMGRKDRKRRRKAIMRELQLGDPYRLGTVFPRLH
jgi:hypothetical protein